MEDGFTPWLQPAPRDFRGRVKALNAADEAAVRRLAAYETDVAQSAALTRAVRQHAEVIARSTGFSAVKLGIVSSHTTDYLLETLPAAGLRHGLLIEAMAGEFGMTTQSVLDPDSSVAAAKPDFVLLSLDYLALGLGDAALGKGQGDARVDEALAQIRTLAEGVRGVVGARCILTTLPAPPAPLFGSFDGALPGTSRAMVERFNARLRAEVAGVGDLVVDVAYLASTIGLARWHDARAWHTAKLPFAVELTPAYADLVGQALGAVRGRARKCLVLDLDNTLWGGVIGDDGLEGIALGQGSATGEAHLAVQRFALSLRERGVLLAVCSKNDEANARQPFREHPDMLLKEDHISVFVANWQDKAQNLRDIAVALNIGADALVFLDDNPAEREIIRANLPEVAVPEIGDDPSRYVERLSRAGYFDAVSFSDEDRSRAELYRANAARLESAGSVTDIGAYLKSLDMEASLEPFDPVGRARIAQLINKSNQFNLTTRRYTDADVEAMESNPDKYTLQVRLADRFGDNGMISVIVFDKGPQVWTCDTWLMSCRVLGRRVEEAVLANVAQAALASGATRLEGVYIPTKKNGLVKEHFKKLGFTQAGEGPDGRTHWSLDLAEWRAPELPIRLAA